MLIMKDNTISLFWDGYLLNELVNIHVNQRADAQTRLFAGATRISKETDG